MPAEPASPGFRGWHVVAGTFFVLTLAFGGAYAFPAFFTPLEQAFPGSRGNISLIFGLSGALFFIVGAPAGQLADRFGARIVVGLGLVLLGVGLIAASFGTALWHVLIAHGLGVGFGVGLAYVPSVGPVQRWFVKRRGTASSFAVTGIGVGTFGGPLLATAVMGWSDWRMAWLVLGTLIIAGGFAATRLMINSPAAIGQWPDNEKPGETRGAGPSWGYTVRAALGTRPFIVSYLSVAVMSFPLFVPFVHLVPYARDHGIGAETSVFLASLIGVGSMLGRFAIGPLADRLGRRNTYIAMFFGLSVAFVLWAFAKSPWSLGVFALLHGTCYGGFVALAPALTVDYLGPKRASGVLGALYTSVALGTLSGPPLAGYAFDYWRSYDLPLTVCAALMMVGTLLTLFLPDPARWREANPPAP